MKIKCWWGGPNEFNRTETVEVMMSIRPTDISRMCNSRNKEMASFGRRIRKEVNDTRKKDNRSPI